MSTPNLIETETTMQHPLEDVLDIEPGSTMLPSVEVEKTDAVKAPAYDEVDTEINEQFQELYDVAMDAYEQQATDIQTIEPKYRARNQEVAVQYLNTALSAAKEKLSIKQSKDKLVTTPRSGPQTLNQNVVISDDRNNVLKAIFGKD